MNQKSDFHETWDERYVIIGHLNIILFTFVISYNNMEDERTCVICHWLYGPEVTYANRLSKNVQLI